MTKKEAIAAKLAWKQALAEGRVVRFNGDQSFRSFKTHEEAKQFAYDARHFGAVVLQVKLP